MLKEDSMVSFERTHVAKYLVPVVNIRRLDLSAALPQWLLTVPTEPWYFLKVRSFAKGEAMSLISS